MRFSHVSANYWLENPNYYRKLMDPHPIGDDYLICLV